jgi:trehalose-6-phosphate synthase
MGAGLSDLYYNGFSNDVLWPLFHYIPLNTDSIHKANQEFMAYEQANMAFARVPTPHRFTPLSVVHLIN